MNVYVMYGKNKEVLYVGQTRNMKLRMAQHFGSQREKWKSEVVKIEYMNCYNEVDMNIYEIYLINKLKPKYNKSFVYDCDTLLHLPYELKVYSFDNIVEEKNYEDTLTEEQKNSFRKLILLYQNKGKSKMNTNYDENAKEEVSTFHSGLNLLTHSWYKKNKNGRSRVLKNVHQICKNGKAKKSSWSGIVDADKGGLSGSELIFLNRYKNYTYQEDVDISEVTTLCYIDNNIVYNDKGELDEYLCVLPLILFLKRSALSVGKEVNLYLPSARMRRLLQNYLEGKILPK